MTSEAERLRRSWEANAPAWRDAVRERRIESRRITDAAIAGAVLERNPRRVLDVGCGEGWLARALSAQGIAVTGIDASSPLIAAARSLGGASFFVMSYEQLAADPSALGAAFDVIVANFSILDDRADALLRAMLPLLASGGVVIVQTVHPWSAGGPYADGWRTETFAAFPGEWPEAMPWYFRTLGSWHRVWSEAGFQVDEIREPMGEGATTPASLIFMARTRTAFPRSSDK